MKPPKVRPAIAPGMELREGDRMTQEEFHRRYEAYPEDVKFELIGGVVHMASPMRIPHGEHWGELATVFGIYKGATAGVRFGGDITAILGQSSEPQPDLLMRLTPESGGQARPNA